MPVLFAQLAEGPPTGLVRTGGYAQDLLVILGAILLVCTLALLWFRFVVRKKHHHHHRHSSTPRPEPEAGVVPRAEGDAEPDTGTEEKGHSRRRHRRRRREHRGRNPSLAETGGLPPPRTEGTLPPPP